MTTNNTNNNEAEQHAEHTNFEGKPEDMDVFQAVISAALKPRSSIPSKFEALNELLEQWKERKDDMYKAYLKYRVYEARLKLARALVKDLNVAACCDGNPYVLAVFLESKADFQYLNDKIKEAKSNKKTSTSKAVVDTHTLDYALSLVNGTVSRAKGTAEALKQAALWLAYYKDSDKNPLEYTAVDSALNKVYAAVRRQAKKNAVEISEKSNKVTKDAVKTAVLERILEMCKNHEYSFEVLIGEA